MRTVPTGTGSLAASVTAAATAAIVLVPGTGPVVAAPPPEPANIVYVVVDDLSANLVPYMSEVVALADEGVSFDNFFVTDSQCCPSRASTLTGMYPHNSGVLTNNGPDGGFKAFAEDHLETSMGPALSDAGYRTGFVGKFLNGYRPGGMHRGADKGVPSYEAGYVPPGWDEWHVSGDGYRNFDYAMASAVDQPVATVEKYGHKPSDYLTDVLSDKTSEFLTRAAAGDDPFFLTVAPFAVHGRVGKAGASGPSRFPPAPRDRAADPTADVPRGWPAPDHRDGDCGDITGGCAAVPFPSPLVAEGFNEPPSDAHRWLRERPLDAKQLDRLHERYLDRIRMAQAVDDLIGRVRADLATLDLDDSTYIVFTSDNGYHLGEHGLRQGKNSAFDHDVRVPMIVVPPSGTAPESVPAIGQNTDLLPTFLDIAGEPDPSRGIDGRSLLPLITAPGSPVAGWREGALVEYTRNEGGGGKDPDRDSHGSPPTYQALRTVDYLYVDYSTDRGLPRTRDAELYDLARDPAATANRYAELSRHERRALDRALEAYAACAEDSCAAASRQLPQISTTGR